MNAEQLLEAIGGIDERYLTETESLRPSHRGKRWLRAALIAAVLACLFSVTAYAVGWFGLGTRVTAEQELSLNGLLGSEEATAYSEWVAFRDAHFDELLASGEDGPFDISWTEESPELAGAAALYDAFDRESAEKLLAIAEEHDLTIHTRALRFSGAERFLRAAGVQPFVANSQAYSGLVYEDGSYLAQLNVPLEGAEEALILYRQFSGTLQPVGMDRALVLPENYVEWSYTNTRGQTLAVALSTVDEQSFAIGSARRESGDNRRFPFFLFYYRNGQYLTASGSLHTGRLHDFDVDAARARLESLADAIDFEAAAGTDCDTAYFLAYTPVSAPADARPDLAAFLAQPEVQATLAMQRELAEAVGLEIGRGMEEALHSGGDLDILMDGNPVAGEQVDALFEALAGQYGLRYPSDGWYFRGGSRIPIANSNLTPADGPAAIAYNLSEEEILSLAGQEDFGCEIRCLLDNGVFWGMDAEYNNYLYLPRGSFLAGWISYALPQAAGSPGWFYENRNGDTVYLVHTEGEPSVGYLLYESEGGWFLMHSQSHELWWLEEAADRLRLGNLR